MDSRGGTDHVSMRMCEHMVMIMQLLAEIQQPVFYYIGFPCQLGCSVRAIK